MSEYGRFLSAQGRVKLDSAMGGRALKSVRRFGGSLGVIGHDRPEDLGPVMVRMDEASDTMQDGRKEH